MTIIHVFAELMSSPNKRLSSATH